MALQGYVFIVTYGRSGSTVLQNLLNQLPGYLIRGENLNALQPLVASWARLRDESPFTDYRRAGRVIGPDHPWHGAELVDVQAYGHALADAFTRTVLTPAPDTRVTGFKEIRWDKEPDFFDTYMEFMRSFFPGARFVINTRAYDGLRASGWWKGMDPSEVRATWESADAALRGFAAAHPDCCCHLHYDDWAGQPDALRPLFRFLGEPWDAQMVAGVLGRKLTHLKEGS